MDIVLFTVWALYSLVEGLREAFLWNKSMYSSVVSNELLGIDIHKVFSLQRAIVMMIILYILANDNDCYSFYRLMGELIIWMFIMSLSFPFIHDGIMYKVRNKIDPSVYKDGFKSNPDPNKSTSFWDFTFLERSVYFVISIVLLIINQTIC